MEILDLPTEKKIILFDGVCNLCETSVQFIIKHDKNDVFRFVSLESELGQKILNHIGVNRLKIDSIVLYEPGIAYYLKAQAAFKIARELSGMYRFIGLFSYLPTYFSNIGYNFIAKNRYKWFGKKDSCMMPTTELQEKFL